MSQYKAYPAYKDSGVKWIGQVPEHWEATKVGFLSQKIGSGKTPSGGASVYTSSGVVFLRSQNIYDDGIRLTNVAYIPLEIDQEMAGTRVHPWDVLLNITGASIGRSAIAPREFQPANVNQHVCIVRLPNSNVARWVHASFCGMSVKTQINVLQSGAAREGLNFEQVGNIRIAFPPSEEAQIILEEIENQTARIDELIEKKTRFIELLKEKRQALITHAVTKGLDPNVKMKDSGVEWIGQVPVHWRVKPFFALVAELNRKNTGLVETNILSLSYGSIIQKPETRNMGLTPESYETYQIVEPGEIIFRFTDLQNDKRSLRSAQVTQRGIITSAYMAVKPHSIDSTYFTWMMRSYDHCKVFYAMGGGLRQSLKFEDVRRLPVLIPPAEEQRDITSTINEGTARIDSLVEKTEHSVNLLKERRAAFITAAVTGQIDLRGEQ